MPVTPTYPGVYIEELPSGVRTIVGVATSITAFVGRAQRGPVNDPTMVQSFAEFDRRFGGLWADSTMSYAVDQYFVNGGSQAVIVRVVHDDDTTPGNNASKTTFSLPAAAGTLELEAANEGAWGNALKVRVDHETRPLEAGEAPNTLFNLSVLDDATGELEVHRNISVDQDHPRFVTRVLESQSELVRVVAGSTVPAERPTDHPTPATGDPFETPGSFTENNDGADGIAITESNLLGDPGARSGVYALEKADLFNILCLPPPTRGGDLTVVGTLDRALEYCKSRRAMLIVDPPSGWGEAADVAGGGGVATLGALRDANAALYFPRIKAPDRLRDNQLEEFVPCGAVAGVWARTDAERGVWKAPAGLEATMRGVQELAYKMTDGENGRINPLGVNAFRTFPLAGHVVWGARTMRGADLLADQWKYLPVRRLALFIEETLYRGTQWVVFEPNDEPLWSQIRLNVGAFMQGLFRQGAFQGQSPRDAYFVRCDSTTTTQADIDRGIVNVIVGFAPLKPAEFVIVKIQQIAQQPGT